MMKGNIGLDAAMIKSSKTILNNLLADHFVLLAKTWNYHWNMKGPSFRSYHTFLEDLYNGLIEDIDSIAERVRDLDERPIGSLKGCLEHNRIKEQDEEKALPDAKGMLTALLDDNAELIRQIREDLETIDKEESKDFGTSNFLEDMIEKKEKVTGMIRAHLE